MSGATGLWDVDRAAREMRLPRKTAYRRLRNLHDEHGGLLFRSEGGRTTKLRVDPARLFELDPSLGKRADDDDSRVADLERRVAELEDFRRKALSWFRGRN